jgi:soluble lytic murein transglycosylase-like protein
MFDMPPCVENIAAFYDVPVELIAGVRLQEGGKVCGVDGPRYDGSYDLGPMQINTWWYKNHDFNLNNFGVSKTEVSCNYCQNISIGTWILKRQLDRYKDLDKALSAYNSGKPKYNGYSTKVLNKIKKFIDPNFKYLQGGE